MSYISFDFHEHCRGMRFENVGILLDTVDELVQRVGYFWVDNHGKVGRGCIHVLAHDIFLIAGDKT